MQASSACTDLIEGSEGFKQSPYRCPAGVPTIGLGSTFYEDGTPVRMIDPAITIGRARSLMLNKLNSEFVPAVNRLVTVKLTQGQFDSCIDFCFNAGEGAFATS